MSQTHSSAKEATTKRTRKTQGRTAETRTKLIDAGALLFSDRVFDAVSIRDLETAAGVNRNVLAHHFGNKEGLWKASADSVMQAWTSEFDKRLSVIREITIQEALAFLIRFHVYFHAENPGMGRFQDFEAGVHSWRIEYLIEQHIRGPAQRMEEWVNKATGLEHDAFVHWYYIMVNSASAIFSLPTHCQSLFGVDPYEKSRVEAHAELMVSMLIPHE